MLFRTFHPFRSHHGMNARDPPDPRLSRGLPLQVAPRRVSSSDSGRSLRISGRFASDKTGSTGARTFRASFGRRPPSCRMPGMASNASRRARDARKVSSAPLFGSRTRLGSRAVIWPKERLSLPLTFRREALELFDIFETPIFSQCWQPYIIIMCLDSGFFP